MARPGLSIGTLARRTATKVETIRYYERIGVMPPPPRTAGGHRLYDAADVKRLRFVQRSRDLGFSLDAVREMLDLADGGTATCDQVAEIAERHLGAVRARLADLRRMEKTLAETLTRCSGAEVPDCPLMDHLLGEADGDERGG